MERLIETIPEELSAGKWDYRIRIRHPEYGTVFDTLFSGGYQAAENFAYAKQKEIEHTGVET